MALVSEYITGAEFHSYLRKLQAGKVEHLGGAPNIIQNFVQPRSLKNNIVRVDWTPTSFKMVKGQNLHSLIDPRFSLETRAVTFEDQTEC